MRTFKCVPFQGKVKRKCGNGTGIPGCIVLLNRNKSAKRKNKIIFIYAARDYEEGKVRNKLREEDIKKIASAFKKNEDVDKYCHIAEIDELKENEFNLNVPRYVDISEAEEGIDIQITINELKQLEKERHEIQVQVNSNLKELGFWI
jgi:type I restriction enzyme M protein